MYLFYWIISFKLLLFWCPILILPIHFRVLVFTPTFFIWTRRLLMVDGSESNRTYCSKEIKKKNEIQIFWIIDWPFTTVKYPSRDSPQARPWASSPERNPIRLGGDGGECALEGMGERASARWRRRACMRLWCRLGSSAKAAAGSKRGAAGRICILCNNVNGGDFLGRG